MNAPPADCVIVIPAYKPGQDLIGTVSALLDRNVPAILVIDDGSGPRFEDVFGQLAQWDRVHLVRHAVNLGKGAALKTGMNYALVHYPHCRGVVTADADGQHDPADILNVAKRLHENPDHLVLGVRTFDGAVPFRSKLGNGATRILMRLVAGQRLTDTQTGLRGIPARLIPDLLRLPSMGYEFELDMLMACKRLSCPILEQPIQTIYLHGNQSSHFRPLQDSMRIYFLLFRFTLLSLFTAAVDNCIFIFSFSATGSIGWSQIAARSVALMFNYTGARSAVFHSGQRHAAVLPRYLAVVACNGLLSYVLIQFFRTRLGLNPVPGKLTAEAMLFLVNFAIQRDFVFTKRSASHAMTATDWDSYYTSVPITAKLTRRYTTSVLLDAIRRHAAKGKPAAGLAITEFGGANSCFLNSIVQTFPCDSYDVVDTNEYGLSLLASRMGDNPSVRLHRQSVLDLSLGIEADLVFSVGLIEHFDPAATRAAIRAHFQAVRPGGIVIITFPTPTLLYCLCRKGIELLGKWKFHDERPLLPREVTDTVLQSGDILFEKTLWPLMLTQHMVVARKHAAKTIQPAETQPEPEGLLI
jgi:glycosyltransferase involved in cell wall biosynthesis